MAWASVTNSDLTLKVALLAGEAALLASLILIASIVILRVKLNVRARRHARLVATWRPILAEMALAPDSIVELPPLERRDRETFLREWNSVRDTLRDASSGGLNAIIERLGLVGQLRDLLRAKRLAVRAVATTALGHLRDAESWPVLAAQLDSDRHPLSYLAARALLQIDPERALPEILARATERHEWTAGRFATLLQRAGADVVSALLCREILRGPAERTAQLLPFVRAVHASDAAATLLRLLETTADEHVVCEVLRVADDPSLLPLVRPYLADERWHVRLLAVEALGRICEPRDMDAIVALLGDEQWWVRYRAAQALVRLPWVDAPRLEQIRAGQTDRYARAILDQAIAERRFQ